MLIKIISKNVTKQPFLDLKAHTEMQYMCPTS